MKRTAKIVSLMLCISLFAAIALGSGSSESDPKTPEKVGEVSAATGTDNQKESAATIPSTEVKTDYYVGDTFSLNGLDLTFVSSNDYVSDNQFIQPAEGNKYIRLAFHVDNNSKSDASVTTFNFSCYADGYECSQTYNDDDLSASLSSGRSADGAVYFEIPQSAAEVEIEYSYNIFSDKRIKFIYEGTKDSGLTFEKNTTASADAFHVGDIIETKDLRISYLRAEDHISDNQFIQPSEGNKYIFIELEIENLSSSDQSVSYLSFSCYADGTDCDGFYGRDDALSATLSAGRKARGTIAFEVPIDASIIEIEYEDNFWTDSKIIFSVK